MTPDGRAFRSALALRLSGAAFGAALLARTASAQLTVDQVPQGRTVTTTDLVESEIERSRFRLGPIRLIPTFEVNEAGYDNNVFSRAEGETKVGDWTASVGAGGRAIVPIGSKFYVRAVVVPEYTWYDKLKDRRSWGGTYTGSILALGNRLSASLSGSYDRGTTLLNSETQALVIGTTFGGAANFEVNLTGKLSFVGGAELEENRYSSRGVDPTAELDVANFNRTDSAALVGFRFRLTPSLDLTAGTQGTRSEFKQDATERDNQTFAFLGGIHYDRPSFFVNLTAGYRKGEPFHGSAFPRYSATVGSYFVSWDVANPIELQAYGNRHPAYSLFADELLYVESRAGGAIVLQPISRVGIRGFGDFGTNNYPVAFTVGGSTVKRVDDVVDYGGSVSVLVVGKTVVRVQGSRIHLKPNVAGVPQRTVVRVFTSLSFNGELTR